MFLSPGISGLDTDSCVSLFHDLINNASGMHITIKAGQLGQLLPQTLASLNCTAVKYTAHITDPIGHLEQVEMYTKVVHIIVCQLCIYSGTLFFFF